MPIPLILIGAGAGLTATGIWIYNNYFKGLNIFALGPQKSGKTTFQHYLRTKEKLYKTNRTNWEILNPSKFTTIDGRTIKLKKGIDAGGFEVKNRKRLEEEFFKSDITFYIFDVSKVYKGKKDEDYYKKVVYELELIHVWMNQKGKSQKTPEIILLGSKPDLIEGLSYEKMDDSEKHEVKKAVFKIFERKFNQIETPIINFFICNILDDEEFDKMITEVLNLNP